MSLSLFGWEPTWDQKRWMCKFRLMSAGLRQTVSDTVGIGGLMKGLRTIPAMLNIARDMERLCPDAPMLNYTNPMAMIMWAVLEATSISGVGLCHSVQGTSKQLANYMGVDYENLRYRVAGINHMAWFLELSQDGETLYPQLNACLEDPEIVARDPVRFDILKHFGRFVTESSRHMAEYVPYFMQHSDEMARLNVENRTAESFVTQHTDREERIAQVKHEAESAPIELASFPRICSDHYSRGWKRIPPPAFTGTCSILISSPTSLFGCCVEVPTLITRAGLQPCYVGALPPQCAALCQTNINMQGLTVRAILEEKREYAYHAGLVDPNTAAQLTLSEIRTTIDRLLDAQGEFMPPLAG